MCPGKGEVITQIWRLKQLEYTWLRSLMQEYADFWEVTGAALDFALRAAGVEPNDAIRGPLMENYLHLDPYPEAQEALAALAGYKLAILSNGNPRMLRELVRNSGLVTTVLRGRPGPGRVRLPGPAPDHAAGGGAPRRRRRAAPRWSRRHGLP
ncbi:MAG TPA: HAD-IA family hydrolase, partial [Stellaceae bacterium]|nr:HAD-IA family hydrolase [Stellaceae bacterium]